MPQNISSVKSAEKTLLRKSTSWSSTIFFSLVLVGIFGPIIAATPKDRWCDVSESSVVCARNWANAAGNLFGFMAASLAAFFAFGQWRAGNRQAQVAMLPALKETFSAAQDLLSVISNVDLQLAAIIENDKLLIEMITGSSIPADLIANFCDASQQGAQQLDALLQGVTDFDRRSLIFTGLEEAYSELYLASIHLKIRVQVTGNALQLVKLIAQTRKGTIIPRPSNLIPQPDLNLIVEGNAQKVSSRGRILRIRHTIESSADVALIRRSKALAE